MGKQKIVIILIAILSIVSICVLKNTANKYLGDRDNWEWNDNWNGNGPIEKDNKPKDKKENNTDQSINIVADNYSDALDKSGNLGKPVLVFYTAEWCKYCRKMKAETMPSPEVSEALKNYILVYVNTDIDRSGVKEFAIENLPSFVVTNYKQEKLKLSKGFMDKNSMVNWLNDVKLFKQPIKI